MEHTINETHVYRSNKFEVGYKTVRVFTLNPKEIAFEYYGCDANRKATMEVFNEDGSSSHSMLNYENMKDMCDSRIAKYMIALS